MKPKLISSNNGLVVKNLRKSLSQKTIVRDISLQVQRGQTIGLLGPNGAGKTTTFYMKNLIDKVDISGIPFGYNS
jgi:lipopolysaccharide export system ATP-binding protein